MLVLTSFNIWRRRIFEKWFCGKRLFNCTNWNSKNIRDCLGKGQKDCPAQNALHQNDKRLCRPKWYAHAQTKIMSARADQNYACTRRPKLYAHTQTKSYAYAQTKLYAHSQTKIIQNYMRTRRPKIYAHAQIKIICAREEQNHAHAHQNHMRTRRRNCMHMRIPKLYAHAHFISKCASHAECAFRFSLSPSPKIRRRNSNQCWILSLLLKVHFGGQRILNLIKTFFQSATIQFSGNTNLTSNKTK